MAVAARVVEEEDPDVVEMMKRRDDEEEVVVEAGYYMGWGAIRGATGGWRSAAMILCVELNERLTTLGVAVNLVTYLTGTMHLGSAASANAVTNFLGTSFMLCLLGGFLADTYLGRYLTIAIFTAVQAAVRCYGVSSPLCPYIYHVVFMHVN